MTDGQKFGFYLPVWRRVQEARGWARKPLNLEEEKFRMWPDPAGPLALKVLLFAKQTALQESREVAAEDLRRACTLVATAALDARSPGSPPGGDDFEQAFEQQTGESPGDAVSAAD
jgi:hypothetical protein